MTDVGETLSGAIGRIDRRQLVGAIVSGAVLGSAWAVSLRDAVLAETEAHVTVARTATALGVLIEYRGHRIMLIDAEDAPAALKVTELSTGLLRRRIDTVLVPATALGALPRDFSERWRVRDIWTLPDRSNATAFSLTGKTLHIGDLAIDTDTVPIGAWRAGASGETAWYVGASHGEARIVITSEGRALEHLPLDAAVANAVVCFDADPAIETLPARIALLAVPVEAKDRIPAGPRIVSLSLDGSVAFRLHEHRIETL